MKIKAARLYDSMDMRIETCELPAPAAGEVLLRPIASGLDLSDNQAFRVCSNHIRVPMSTPTEPVITGHELCAEVAEVGEGLEDRFSKGDKVVLFPSVNGAQRAQVGFTFPCCGGNAQYAVVPRELVEAGCLMKFDGAYYEGCMTLTLANIIGAFRSMVHLRPGEYIPTTGPKTGGKIGLFAGCGPAGMTALDYVLHGDINPAQVLVTDNDPERMELARRIFSVGYAAKKGVELQYVDTSVPGSTDYVFEITGCEGYSDSIVFAPVASVFERASTSAAAGGCVCFFATSANRKYMARMNLFRAHYEGVIEKGFSGGCPEDLKLALEHFYKHGLTSASKVITHVGGLDATIDATNLCELSTENGCKKIIYPQIALPLTEITNFDKCADSKLRPIAEIVKKHGGWSKEAEDYLLKNARSSSEIGEITSEKN